MTFFRDNDTIHLNNCSNVHASFWKGKNNMCSDETAACEYMHIHGELVKKVNENMPSDDILYNLAELYKVFGDSTRIKILGLFVNSPNFLFYGIC